MHYPSAYAPPVGIWWWDESSGAVRHHYLAGDADISGNLAGELEDVASASEWRDRLAKLRKGVSPSASDDTMRTLTTNSWSPVDILLATISHWPLRW
ncbi:MAG TPA: hypothetical protein VE441_11075 [Mycobacterium sp.]|nr:hypothetical protein [Mycobacterium sp.]